MCPVKRVSSWYGKRGRGKTYPFESHFASRLNWDESTIALRQLVAHDIHAAKPIGRNESVVQVVRLPSDSSRNGILILERSVPALVRHAVGNDFIDVPVGQREGREERESECRLHCVCLDEVKFGRK